MGFEWRKHGREEPWKLKYFGIGNENWGCGGSMRPQYYADLFRRYQTFVRSYGEEPILKIAGGPDGENYEWMEVLMREDKDLMGAISLHYYTRPGDWEHKGDSLVFDEEEWYDVMGAAQKMEELLTNHSAIMDRYDPEKKVGLIVDEWGTWFDVMPGTNPGFLYQQNTMRDAVSAVLSLHSFHRHCGRVVMANIAQMVNVLQAMILTEGEKMVLTPTYHLFRMMKGHMDSELLDVDYTAGTYMAKGTKTPAYSISASEKDGIMTVSCVNTRLDKAEEITLEIRDRQITAVSAELLAADDMHAANTFEEPERVKPVQLDITAEGNTLHFTLPAASVAVLTIK